MEDFLRLIKTKIAILLSALTLSGCLQIFTTVSVNPDGSGEVEETIYIGKNLLNLFQSISVMFQDSTKTMTAEEIFNRDEIAANGKKLGEGVELTKFENLHSGDLSGYKATFSFGDISKIKIDQNPDNKMPSFGQENETATQNGQISFAFEKGMNSNLKILLPQMQSDEKFAEDVIADDTSFVDQKAIDEFVEMFEGLKVSVQVKINGEIISTDARHVDGGVITLLNFDIKQILKNPDLIKTFKAQKPSNIAELEKFAGLIPGFQIEFNKIVNVTFK